MSAGFNSDQNGPIPLVSHGAFRMSAASVANGQAGVQPQAAAMSQSDPSQLQPSCTVVRSGLPIVQGSQAVDRASIEGKFGWMTLDSANIPCLFRGNEKYISVRMVEQKLLSRYPCTYPEELSHRAPLTSQFVTSAEAKLLNEINIEHCACEYGQQPFTEQDLIVTWSDFVDFYRILKKYFPSEKLLPNPIPAVSQVVCMGGGWVQVNNTVVPYVRRLAPSGKETLRLVPLTVIRYAANILVDTEVPVVDPTEQECQKLTEMCQSAGLAFTFTIHSTPLVLLTLLPVYSGVNVLIKRLPDGDPFSGAQYCAEFETAESRSVPNSCASLPTTQAMCSVSSGRAGIPGTKKQMVSALSPAANPAPSMNISRPDLPGDRRGVGLESVASSVQNLRPNTSVESSRNIVVSGSGTVPPPAKEPRALTSGTDQTSALGFIMPPPGMVPGVQGAWRPQVNNPDDMKKLAEMMNMQAAILSQTGVISTPNHLFQESSSAESGKPINMKVTPNLKLDANSTKSSDVMVENSIRIKPVDFHGKKVSCLVKEGSRQQFALVEAISRVYFPYCDLDEFLHTISNVLQLSMYQLNRQEEQAFIQFYGLPTKMLKCTKVLNLQDLDPYMPHLRAVFCKMVQNMQSGQMSESPVRNGLHLASTTVPQTGKYASTDANVGHGIAQPDGYQILSENSVPTNLLSMNCSLKPRSFGSQNDVLPMTNVKVFVTPSIEEQIADLPETVTRQKRVQPQMSRKVRQPNVTSIASSHQTVSKLLAKPARKRTAKTNSAGLGKLSRLEDAVNRLHQSKMRELSYPSFDQGMGLVETSPGMGEWNTSCSADQSTTLGSSGIVVCNEPMASSVVQHVAMPSVTATTMLNAMEAGMATATAANTVNAAGLQSGILPITQNVMTPTAVLSTAAITDVGPLPDVAITAQKTSTTTAVTNNPGTSTAAEVVFSTINKVCMTMQPSDVSPQSVPRSNFVRNTTSGLDNPPEPVPISVCDETVVIGGAPVVLRKMSEHTASPLPNVNPVPSGTLVLNANPVQLPAPIPGGMPATSGTSVISVASIGQSKTPVKTDSSVANINPIPAPTSVPNGTSVANKTPVIPTKTAVHIVSPVLNGTVETSVSSETPVSVETPVSSGTSVSSEMPFVASKTPVSSETPIELSMTHVHNALSVKNVDSVPIPTAEPNETFITSVPDKVKELNINHTPTASPVPDPALTMPPATILPVAAITAPTSAITVTAIASIPTTAAEIMANTAVASSALGSVKSNAGMTSVHQTSTA
ncbi:hypothetical protein LSH36_352g03066 [Paralvinella palmiformis]|uniref:Uncharacterized protein n=1 Tax=Paralvinella palmiformis TaxID=53620 RepID=A0AAD9JGJ6_9ANNE|nr:hypothetical protein LSH36_352g03066 [Paralvinella palmiformis]